MATCYPIFGVSRFHHLVVSTLGRFEQARKERVTVHADDPCRLAGRWNSLTAKAAPDTVKSPF